MTLSDIKAYLLQRQRVTLADLTNHFRCDAHTLEPMLAQWERKGKLRHIRYEGCRKGCCNSGTVDIYEWTNGKESQPLSVIPIATGVCSSC